MIAHGIKAAFLSHLSSKYSFVQLHKLYLGRRRACATSLLLSYFVLCELGQSIFSCLMFTTSRLLRTPRSKRHRHIPLGSTYGFDSIAVFITLKVY
ncbi:hypothetical protein DFH29DRAFT_927928 [Suillus ampliporus]|nr:hypothetical protein DFH29DRAFT_927928 [Suillus ampliporus]